MHTLLIFHFQVLVYKLVYTLAYIYYHNFILNSLQGIFTSVMSVCLYFVYICLFKRFLYVLRHIQATFENKRQYGSKF
jgi:hypothetical protein